MPKYLDESGLTRFYDNIADRPVHTFDTVAEMQAATYLKAGMTCHTNGFHTSGDGGAAYYTISSSGTANGMDVLACANSLFATLVVTGPYVTPEQFGAYGDSDYDGINGHDDTYAIQRMFTIALNSIYAADGSKIYKITEPIIIPNRIVHQSITFLGTLAYTGTDYALIFNKRISDSTIALGQIFSKGGCIKFETNSTGNEYIAGLHLSCVLLYAGLGANGNCVYVNNQYWFNENFISKVNFQHGNYGVYIQCETTSDLGRLLFDACHFEGITNGVYVNAESQNNIPSGIKFTNCRMVETPSGDFCNIIVRETLDSPSLGCVIIDNEVLVRKLKGNVIYVITVGHQYDAVTDVKIKGLTHKIIYNGVTLNPLPSAPRAQFNMSQDASNPTIIDLTSKLEPLEFRGTDNNTYYLQLNFPQLEFYYIVTLPITGWRTGTYVLTIPLASGSQRFTVSFSTTNEFKMLYVDYRRKTAYIM